MKKLFILGITLVAFAACKNGATPTEQIDVKVETAYDIAYIKMDSLLTNYNRYIDVAAEFELTATKAQKDLESRARRLQRDMADLQEKAEKGLMTRSQIAQAQEDLERRGQNFETQRQNKMTELAEQEQVMTNQILHAIQQYVAKYNADLRFKMVLTTSGGTPVLHADPSLDITKEVLDGLNAEYKTEQAKKK